MEIAVFGGGCFWCTEAVFRELRGVESVISGYAGGPFASSPRGDSVEPGQAPTYEKVSMGRTSYAEVIKVEFRLHQISYRDLLTVFFAIHDPTTEDRQGADIGTQYRSIILYTTEQQKSEAKQYIAELVRSGVKVVTVVQPLEKFYEAEEEHKTYYEKNSSTPYCQLVIVPKLQKLQLQFRELLRSHGK